MRRLRLGIPTLAAALSIMGGLATSEDAASRAAKTFRDCETCPEMVVIPPRTFILGSPETEKDRDKDEGQHKVTITYSFAVSKGPITWDQWEACAREAMCDGQAVETALRLDREGKPIPDYVDHGRGNHPIVGVSWWDAQAYVGWLNRKIGKEKYRLLSESEFEYAAPAGTTTAYWWGNNPTMTTLTTAKRVARIWAESQRDAMYGRIQPLRYDPFRRMPLACATCTATSISGSKTATKPTSHCYLPTAQP
jgi:formylglycine-generating enzyme required for sulfatase activity